MLRRLSIDVSLKLIFYRSVSYKIKLSYEINFVLFKEKKNFNYTVQNILRLVYLRVYKQIKYLILLKNRINSGYWSECYFGRFNFGIGYYMIRARILLEREFCEKAVAVK